MEQQLINALMKLTAKAGAGFLIRDLVQLVDENGSPKIWNASEIAKAIYLINWQIDHFDKSHAITVIHSLMKKFDITTDDITTKHDDDLEITHVQGLQ